jgi:omega-6 fatty acid desaturase (delta-12 desaturase)
MPLCTVEESPAVAPCDADIGADTGAEISTEVHAVAASVPFAAPDRLAGASQLASIAVGVAGCFAVIVAAPWAGLKLAASLCLSGVMVRAFVLQHDCGHRSLLPGRRANDRAGLALSWFTGISYDPWRLEHLGHHRHQGRLDLELGRALTRPMTVAGALAAPLRARLLKAAGRPLLILLLGSLVLVLGLRLRGFYQPFAPWEQPGEGRLQAVSRGHRVSQLGHLVFHLAAAGLLGWSGIGWWLLAFALAHPLSVAMFWLQHNFEGAWYSPRGPADHLRVALEGSSYLRLHPVLDWFTASIGLHHVHHLNPAIPNYRLEQARRAVPALAAVAPLSRRQILDAGYRVFWWRGRLERSDAVAMPEHAGWRAAFVLASLASLPLYALGVALTPALSARLAHGPTVVSVTLQVIFALGGGALLVACGLRPADMGLRLAASRRAIAEGLAVAAAFALAAIPAKALLAPEAPLFDGLALTGPVSHALLFAAVYAGSAVLQEGLARGLALAGLTRLGCPAPLAVALTTAIFAGMHLHHGAAFALASAAPGLAWALLALRHRGLAGAITSHVALGGFTILFLGISILETPWH